MKMKIKINIILFSILLVLTSCISTKNTIKNIDDNAPDLTLKKDNTFLITEYSKNPKYGFDPDYPINLYFKNSKSEDANALRFLNALAGPKGETISYTKIETCCPFPSKRTSVGAGLLDVYEITWKDNEKPLKIYLNLYEKGHLAVPVGLGLKK
jgi:hypothetical protein